MLRGGGLLSLWNGVDPGRLAEYGLWHTREHVPERLAISGMLRARRYHRGEGPLPEFLTLYELESNAVLASPSYRELLVTPTPWSRSMRPSFRGFFRVGHRAVLSHGGGVGSALMAATFEDGEAAADAWQEVAEQVLAETAATAVHVLRKDPAVAPVPFAVPSSGETSHPDGGAIMIESHERSAFAEIARVLDPALEMRGLARGRASWTVYDLAYLLDKEELPVVVALSRLEA